ncbi:MAG: ZIP family metal transporter [Nanoarchaeota archaeon]|nr:ZIP family metal transporter [Nanoarchaeota archaeon]MBU1321778.1 ZIP family metal transporter [Nanoarchaeota archaeon]MBU1598477.1 ZIP family metal transporter [Nanoarchaeota archaeon]MBU2440811.1 ZIP family metal transporter [Nanoarchaeota archaeon]
MNVLIWIILATVANGLIALTGVFSLWIKDKVFNKIIMVLVAFSAGALLSGAFFHLLPEALEELPAMTVFGIMMIGFIMFFIIEKFLHWHHCHKHGEKCKVHPISYLILIGDSVHNFIDGIIIGVSFMVNIHFGIITTLLIMGHELPQELGDFGVLVYGGFSKTKALVCNLISQLVSVVGGIVGYIFASHIEGVVPYILPFAAGGFIYIAASDLIPELHKESNLKKSMMSFVFFLIGIGFMFLLKFLFHH